MHRSPFSRFRPVLRPVVQGALGLGFILLPLLIQPGFNDGPPPQLRPPTPYFLGLVNALLVALIYLNTRIFIPKVLNRRGMLAYTLCLLGYLVLMLGVSFTVRALTLGREQGWSGPFFFATLFPALFVFSISTTYTILSEFYKQQQLQKERENERLKADLAFLRWQISPHFMFNALNSIAALARLKSEQTEAVTIQLAGLMRYMLYESDEAQVPLAREVQYLSSFVELQRLRFGKKVTIEFEAPALESPQSIEPMLLIPFVENAFKHGVSQQRQPVVRVQLRLTDDQLHLRVQNKALPAGQTATPEPDSGIGLKNVRRRLALLYPDQHSLQIHQDSAWFTVELTLHLHWKRRISLPKSNAIPA